MTDEPNTTADGFPLGWIPFDERSAANNRAHDEALGKMPLFSIAGPVQETPPVGTKVLLTDVWKHPSVVKKLGFEYTGIHQLTGSCIGAGGGNVLFTLAAIEVLRLGQNEELFVPFWLLPYGISRLDCGEHGKGEGSLGSTFAQACRENGVVDAALDGLPRYTTDNGLTWTSGDEMTWSDGQAISSKWLDLAKKHLVQTTAQLNSGAAVRDAILNGYPVTRAWGYFANPGSPKVQNGALVGRYDGAGGHQEAHLGYWNHPDLGELIFEMNQWGRLVYDQDPGGGPLGGCWQKMDAVDKMAKSGDAEVFAFSQFEGYPAQALSYLLF